MMPPGASRAFAPSKNSFVNSAATPAIHGFDGSLMITSYCWRDSIRCERPSPTISCVRGSSSALWFSTSKKCDASTTSCEISTTSARSTGWLSAAPRVTPLPSPMMAMCFGLGCSSSGRCATSFCVSMSLRLEASVLPSTASVVVPVSRFTDTVAGAPSL